MDSHLQDRDVNVYVFHIIQKLLTVNNAQLRQERKLCSKLAIRGYLGEKMLLVLITFYFTYYSKTFLSPPLL